MKHAKILENKLVVGWHEWCALPKLNLPAIKAKIDTGAKTSALHAFDIDHYCKNHKDYVRFYIHPVQANDDIMIRCKARVVDVRYVMSSNGHKEKRYVISTPLELGGECWDIEVTLSNRDPLTFRMLLGREAMGKHVIVDPHRINCQGKMSKRQQYELYK
jgi:ribosomal protein S6--L-glutamate ligase